MGLEDTMGDSLGVPKMRAERDEEMTMRLFLVSGLMVIWYEPTFRGWLVNCGLVRCVYVRVGRGLG